MAVVEGEGQGGLMTMKQRRTLAPFTDEHEALSSMSKTRRPACDDEASGAVKNNSFVIRLLGVVEKYSTVNGFQMVGSINGFD